MRADEIMTRDVVTIRASQSIADAIDVFAEHGMQDEGECRPCRSWA